MANSKIKTAPVDRYMTPSPHTIDVHQSLEQAHRLMRAHRIRHLPVVNQGNLVGMVSQRDLLLIESLPDVRPDEVPVADAMTRDVFAVRPGTPLEQVVVEMADRRRGSVVVAEGANVRGVFTTVDACRALATILAESRAPATRAVAAGRGTRRVATPNRGSGRLGRV